MLAVLLFGWRKRFLPYMVLIIAYLLGQGLFGVVSECRIYMQILPLSLLILAERFRPGKWDGSRTSVSEEWWLPESAPAVPLIAILACLLIPVLAGRYFVLCSIHGSPERWVNYQYSEMGIKNCEETSTWIQGALSKAKIKVDDPATGGGQKKLAEEVGASLAVLYFNINSMLTMNLLHLGQYPQAMAYSRTVIQYPADNEDSDHLVWFFLNAVGRYIKPDDHVILDNNLAFFFATAPNPGDRNGAEAVRLGEEACQSDHGVNPGVIGTLAAAYAEAGRYDDAVATAEKARALALKLGNQTIAQKNEELIKLYQAHEAFHESAGAVY